MAEKHHMLEIYDVDGYDGPNPITVTGAGTVQGPENRQYYVLTLREAVHIDGSSVSQLAVSPHYGGDTIRRATDGVCTVGIALPKPGHDFEPGKSYGFSDFCFWKVGKIHPSNGNGA